MKKLSGSMLSSVFVHEVVKLSAPKSDKLQLKRAKLPDYNGIFNHCLFTVAEI